MRLTNRNATGVAVYTPTYARILSTDVETKTGVLETTIESHEAIDDLALVLAPEDASMAPARIPAAQWKRRKGSVASVKTALFPDAGKINAQLVGRGELIDEAVTGSPPLAARAHAALDENCAWLRKLLGLDGKKVAADGFEVGVAALLNLAGIPAVHYGHDSGNHFPDLIAAVDDEHLIVAECTVDAPTMNKIQTPASRADAIRARASRGDGRHVNLLRVLFTPKSLNEITPDIKSAAEGKLSVALVTRERLAELLDDIVRGESQAMVWWKLLNWISRYGSVRL